MTNTITAIEQQKRNPNRVNIYLDGDYAFPLAKIVAAWLTVGLTLTTEKIEQLKSQDEIETALQKAIDFIDYRPRTQAEVGRRLRRDAIPEETINNVIERLKASHTLDDRNFAHRWVEDRGSFKPRGAFALRAELRRKGLPADVIEEAVAGLDEAALARAAAEHKAAHLNGLSRQEFRAKLSAHLSRRGFEYELIGDICREMWDATMENKSISSKEA